MISTNIEENLSTLLNEKQIAKYSDDTCPREIATCQIEKLFSELKQENAEFQLGLTEYMVIFNISDENTSKIIRAIQEDQLLKTKLKLKQKNRLITQKSYL